MLSVFHWFHTAVLFKIYSWYIQKMFWYCPSLKKSNFGNGSTVQTPLWVRDPSFWQGFRSNPFGKESFSQLSFWQGFSLWVPVGPGSPPQPSTGTHMFSLTRGGSPTWSWLARLPCPAACILCRWMCCHQRYGQFPSAGTRPLCPMGHSGTWSHLWSWTGHTFFPCQNK